MIWCFSMGRNIYIYTYTNRIFPPSLSYFSNGSVLSVFGVKAALRCMKALTCWFSRSYTSRGGDLDESQACLLIGRSLDGLHLFLGSFSCVFPPYVWQPACRPIHKHSFSSFQWNAMIQIHCWNKLLASWLLLTGLETQITVCVCVCVRACVCVCVLIRDTNPSYLQREY